MTDTTSLREPMPPQYMAEVVQAAIETLCANGFQSRTHRLCEVRDQLLAARDEAGAVGSAYDGLCPCCGEIECEEPATPPAASGDDLITRLRIIATDYKPGSILRNTLDEAIRRLAAVAPAGMVLEKVEALVLQMDDEARAEYDRCIREKAGEEEFAAAVATQNAVNRIGRQLGVLVDAAPTPPATAGKA